MSGSGVPGHKPPGPRSDVGSPGANTGVRRWYRQAKATKRGSKGGGMAEHLVVPASPGNRTRRDPEDRRMVSVPPAPPDCGTASDTGAEADGSFRLLRDHGQFRSLVPPAIRGGSALAEMVGSPETGRHHALRSLRAVVAAFSAGSGAGGPLSVLSGSESMTDEPDAGNLHVWICGSPGWVTTRGAPAHFSHLPQPLRTGIIGGPSRFWHTL
jgi:hypothetical protein